MFQYFDLYLLGPKFGFRQTVTKVAGRIMIQDYNGDKTYNAKMNLVT